MNALSRRAFKEHAPLLALAGLLLSGPAAFAQTAPATPAPAAPAAAAAPAAPAPMTVTGTVDEQATWVKVCQPDPQLKRDVCRTGYDLRSPGTQSLIVSVMLADDAGAKGANRLLVSLPNAMLIQPGVKMRIDQDKEQDVKYAICFQNSCMAAIDVNDQWVNRLKTARTMAFTTVRDNQQQVTFNVPLDTFKAAIEGQATPAEVLIKRDEAIQQRAEDTAKTMEERLLEAQRKAQQQ